MSAPTDKWSAITSGERYAARRFASLRASERDPLLVTGALERHGVRGAILDAPCGTGRLHAKLARFGAPLAGLDVSASMLAVAAQAGLARVVRGEIAHLPCRERAFDVVVCCRYLHHLHSQDELERAVRELVRVSSRLVIASFWDAASLPAWRVRLGLKRSEGPRGRRAISTAAVERAVERAGAHILEYRRSLRFVSQQTFFVAERDVRRATP